MVASLSARVTEIISNPKDSTDPFGEVNQLLRSIFFPDVPIGFLVVLYIFSGLMGILCLLGAISLGARWKKRNLVFATRQGGFIVPGTACLFLVGWTVFFPVAEVWLWKALRMFRGNGTYPGSIQIQTPTWTILALTGYIEVWGLLCAANFNPDPVRSFQHQTRPPFLPSGLRLGKHRKQSSQHGPSIQSLSLSRPEPLIPPLVFNIIFVVLLPFSFLALMLLQGVLGAHNCEKDWKSYRIAQRIAFQASLDGISNTDNRTQDVMQNLLDPVGQMDVWGSKCNYWQRFYYATMGSFVVFLVAGDIVGFVVLQRKIKAQISLLHRVTNKHRVSELDQTKRRDTLVAESSSQPQLLEPHPGVLPSPNASHSVVSPAQFPSLGESSPILSWEWEEKDKGKEKGKSGKPAKSPGLRQISTRPSTGSSTHSQSRSNSNSTPTDLPETLVPTTFDGGNSERKESTTAVSMVHGVSENGEERIRSVERIKALQSSIRNLKLQVAALTTAGILYVLLSWIVFVKKEPNKPDKPMSVGFLTILDYGAVILVGFPLTIALLMQGLRASPNHGSFIGNQIEVAQLFDFAHHKRVNNEDEGEDDQDYLNGFKHTDPPLHRSFAVEVTSGGDTSGDTQSNIRRITSNTASMTGRRTTLGGNRISTAPNHSYRYATNSLASLSQPNSWTTRTQIPQSPPACARSYPSRWGRTSP